MPNPKLQSNVQYKSVDLLPNCQDKTDSMNNTKFESISDFKSNNSRSPNLNTSKLLKGKAAMDPQKSFHAKQFSMVNPNRQATNQAMMLTHQKKSSGVLKTTSVQKMKNHSKSNLHQEINAINQDEEAVRNNQKIILEKLRQINIKREITQKQNDKL